MKIIFFEEIQRFISSTYFFTHYKLRRFEKNNVIQIIDSITEEYIITKGLHFEEGIDKNVIH
jgi:hypothetical protein